MTGPRNIAVVGGGVTGLLIGQGLKKHGFNVIIYERDPSLQHRDDRPVSFMIHWGFEMLESLLTPDQWIRIRTTYCNPALSADHESAGIPFYHGDTGELLFQSPPGVMRRVTRQKLRALAAEGLDIRWGTTVEGLDAKDDDDEAENRDGAGVTLRFSDGSKTKADMVIGADGPRSRIRLVLLGEDKAACEESGFVCGFTSAIVGKELAEKMTAAHNIWAMAYHSMGVIAVGVEDAKDPDDKSSWCFNITRIWRGESPKIDGQAAIDIMKENTKTYCEPFRSVVAGIPDGSPAFVRPLKYWRTMPWPNFDGKVTMAGDAAHPMLPFRGQGLNHALDDAFKLVQALCSVSKGNQTLKDAIGGYESDVLDRGAAAVDTAVKEGQLVQNMDKLRDMMVAKKGVAK